MSRYYNDEEKITFDEADWYVSDFIIRFSDRRSVISVDEVARENSIETSRHNMIRLTEALDDRLRRVDNGNSTKTRYYL